MTTTDRVKAALARIRGETPDPASPSPSPERSQPGAAPRGYAHSWDDLARALGTTRRSLQTWRSRPDLIGLLPIPAADGRHDIAAWSQAMIDHGLAGADETEERKNHKDRREELQCIKLEREIDREDGKLLVASELEVAIGQLLAGLAAALNHLPGSAARFVVGIRDIHIAQAKLEAIVSQTLAGLNAARYLEADCIESAVQSLVLTGEAAELMKTVAFSGQDQVQLMRLVAIVSREVIGAVGRRALAPYLPDPAPVLDVAAPSPAPAGASVAPSPSPVAASGSPPPSPQEAGSPAVDPASSTPAAKPETTSGKKQRSRARPKKSNSARRRKK